MNQHSKITETIARVCHEANKALCEANGDFTQTSWEATIESNRYATMQGVEFILNNPNCGHTASHDKWMQSMLEKGWVYGAVKSVENKTNPSLVPFEQLSPLQQLKDVLFCNIVKSFIK